MEAQASRGGGAPGRGDRPDRDRAEGEPGGGGYARGEKIGDVDYVYYEYISRGLPTSPRGSRRRFGTRSASPPRGAKYLYTYTISAPETLWDVNAAGFEQGIRAFKLVEPNKKKFREPGNEGILPPLPF